MPQSEESTVMARAAIDPPPGMQTGDRRVTLVLMPSIDGRYRWYREDGSATVVGARSVDGARRAAELAWKRWNLEFEATVPQD